MLLKLNFYKKVFFINTLLFILLYFFYLIFPNFDILFSGLFFIDGTFISEKYVFIKFLRTLLKNIMILFPICILILLVIQFINKKQNIKMRRNLLLNKRVRFTLIGMIIGPIIGCGLIANYYFKDQWGRARPINIEEFGGKKIYTPPFVVSDQCLKNCSWISGEASAAFSFLTGLFLLKKKILLKVCFYFGILVIFGRLAMGGHFLSDNLFAAIFMIYLALIYRACIILMIKKKFF